MPHTPLAWQRHHEKESSRTDLKPETGVGCLVSTIILNWPLIQYTHASTQIILLSWTNLGTVNLFAALQSCSYFHIITSCPHCLQRENGSNSHSPCDKNIRNPQSMKVFCILTLALEALAMVMPRVSPGKLTHADILVNGISNGVKQAQMPSRLTKIKTHSRNDFGGVVTVRVPTL